MPCTISTLNVFHVRCISCRGEYFINRTKLDCAFLDFISSPHSFFVNLLLSREDPIITHSSRSYLHLSFGNIVTRPHPQQQYHQYPMPASFATFEAADRTSLNQEGISDDETRQEEIFVESTLNWISLLASNQIRQSPRLEVGIILSLQIWLIRLLLTICFHWNH